MQKVVSNYFLSIIITKNIFLQNNLESSDFINLQKTLKTVQMEKDMLLKKIENDKLIRDNSSDNDVSICKTIYLKTMINVFL